MADKIEPKKALPEKPKSSSPIKRPFENLCEKHKVGKLEKAGLRAALPLDMNGMITEDEFTKGRARWLKAPAGK